jgi:transposase
MVRSYRKFDEDFKQGAVALVIETGKPIARVARDLGINDGTLGNWCARQRRAPTSRRGWPSLRPRVSPPRASSGPTACFRRCSTLRCGTVGSRPTRARGPTCRARPAARSGF